MNTFSLKTLNYLISFKKRVAILGLIYIVFNKNKLFINLFFI